jgi:hypothetical protein
MLGIRCRACEIGAARTATSLLPDVRAARQFTARHGRSRCRIPRAHDLAARLALVLVSSARGGDPD